VLMVIGAFILTGYGEPTSSIDIKEIDEES
jgi:hypothetical protein